MEKNKKWLWIDRDPALRERNYIGMFDLAKGLMMIQIILSHCANDYWNAWFYSGGQNIIKDLLLSPLTILRYGSVSMLFMICGYGIRRQSVRKSIKSNMQTLLIPYFGVIVAIMMCIFMKQLLVGGSFEARFRYQVLPFFMGFHPGSHFLGGAVEQIGPVWFFWTYAFGCVFLNLILQERQTWIQILLLATSTVFAMLLTGIPLPYCMQQIVICSGYMYAGMQLKRNKVPQKRLPVYMVLLVYVLCTICTALGGMIEIANNIYALGGIDLAVTYIAGVILLCLYQRLNVLHGILADGVRWIGRHMMWFCCLHTISYLVVPWNRIAECFGEHRLAGYLFECGFSLGYALIGCVLLEKGIRVFMKKRKQR